MSLRQRPRSATVSQAPFPYQQLFILALCRICEPIAFMSIFPYIYFMITSFQITNDEDQIGLYAGLVTSAFAFAEFSTGVFWGRLSDRIGRKPVLMIGLVGTLISMLVFGFASSLPVALLARALGGALNGNIGVLQTTVAEIVTEKEHQLVLVFGILIGILFLEETHQEKGYRRDIGLEAGRKIQSLFNKRTGLESFNKLQDASFEESRPLLEDEAPPGYRTTEGSPRYPSSRSLSPAAPPYTRSALDTRPPRKTVAPSIQTAFTRPVVIHIIGYGILA
ncbi:MAG: hypothetical protein Q9215_001575 [Flavoplaca cf. flavocitrina]